MKRGMIQRSVLIFLRPLNMTRSCDLPGRVSWPPCLLRCISKEYTPSASKRVRLPLVRMFSDMYLNSLSLLLLLL
jgi:hypothetical protein